MKTESDLQNALRGMDHRGYPAYKSLAGAWQFPSYFFVIDHVQGDPFAAPSSVHLEINGRAAGFPEEYWKERHRRIALEDCLTRHFAAEASRHAHHAGSGRSGAIECSHPGQEILERTACHVDADTGNVRFRFRLGFPARGRSIDARAMEELVFKDVREIAGRSLYYASLNHKELQDVMELADDQKQLRQFLREEHLAAFVADGAVLPRQSGISEKPLQKAVPFVSPETLRMTAVLPHRGAVSGMGIREGVTLIVGGGYHGKSTLLSALMLGVYNHVGGDGRELVVTDNSAVKVRAEDGRSVICDDISMFIHNLPDGTDSRQFSSENASGSTSQAASMAEAMEAGTRVLLIDEDTSATNLMMRDSLMEQAVPPEEEPITPLIDRIRELYERMQISTILVAGSFGAYFEKADTVLRMDHYRTLDITDQAKSIAEGSGGAPAVFIAEGTGRNPAKRPQITWQGPPSFQRIPERNRMFADDRLKVKTLGLDGFSIDRGMVDLRLVEQLVHPEQVSALAFCLCSLEKNYFDGRRTLQEAVDLLYSALEEEGLEFLSGSSRSVPFMAMPRRQEIFAAVNRYRGLVIKKT